MRGRLDISVGLGLLAVVAGWAAPAFAESSEERTARRIHERRYYERQGERRQQQIQEQQEQQRSRPVPPTGGNSQVVPNR